MNDYSDLIFLIAAIAIYGVLVTNTNRALLMNNQILTNSEIEYGAISLAQDILDEVQWTSYDELDESVLEGLYEKQLYDDTVDIDNDPSDCPTSYPCKKVKVLIESDYLKNPDGSRRTISMSLIKTNY